MKSKKGFTLAELLVVVAITAVLVAISIPIFAGQLEKSREATDLANMRAAYADVMAAYFSDDESNNTVQFDGTQWHKEIKVTQRINGWQYFDKNKTLIGNIPLSNMHNDVSAGQVIQIYCDKDGVVKFWYQCPNDPDGRGCSYS